MQDENRKKSKGQGMDLTTGSIGRKMLRFAIPLACTGILQQIFNSMDVMIVGRFVGKTAMAAVGSNSAIIGLMINLFVGVSLGANVVISRFTGQRDYKSVSRSVHTAILVALIAGVCMSVLGMSLSRPILSIMGVPEEVFPMALAYLRIYILGFPVIFLYNFEASIFRSQGDTKTPLIILGTAGVLNVLLNLLFVTQFGMAADGVALATVLSNGFSAVALFVLLLRTKLPVRVSWSKFGIDWSLLKMILKIGVPAGIQGMVFSISNICVQSAINSLGSDVMAASSAAFNVEVFIFFVFNAFGQATTTFIGQNIGAGKLERCKKVIKMGMFQGMAATIVLGILANVFAAQLIYLFNTDEIVIAHGVTRIAYICSFQFLNAIMEVLSGAMRGFGYSLSPAVVTLVGVVGLRLIWVFGIFPTNPTFALLLICYPLSWLITNIGMVINYLAHRKIIYPKAA